MDNKTIAIIAVSAIIIILILVILFSSNSADTVGQAIVTLN